MLSARHARQTHSFGLAKSVAHSDTRVHAVGIETWEANMTKGLLQTSSLALVLFTGCAFANEARVLDASPVAAEPGRTYASVAVTYQTMETPDHGNGTIQFDLDGVGDVSPQFLGADLEGWSWSVGMARDLASGWRIGGFLRGVEADGDDSAAYDIPDGTPFRHGLLDGTQNGSGNYGGTGSAEQTLSVDYEALFGTLTFGRDFGGGWRADAILALGNEETDYRNVQYDTTFDELHITNTRFNVDVIEISGRVATSFALSPSFRFDVAGALGVAIRDIDMDADTVRDLGAPVLSTISVSDEETAIVGGLSGSLVWQLTSAATISLNAGWTYDGGVPAYVAPNYVTGAAASIRSEEETGAYVGLRLGGTW
jgi:hypothetical protein